MKWRLGDIATWVDGRIEGADPDLKLDQVVVDSRQLIEPGALFVALEGPRFDGHDFVGEALNKGAQVALVSRDIGEGPRVIVDDTLDALQTFGARWREQFSIPVIGITGSNGKTIVKDMLASILGRQMTVHRSPGSFNSQVGVPLSLLALSEEHEVAIIEAGISERGEMEHLEAMIRPSKGLITNIGLAHAAGLGDLETTAAEKKKLFRRVTEEVVIPAGEPLVDDETFHVKHHRVAGPHQAMAQDLQCDVVVGSVERRAAGFDFQLQWATGRTVAVSLQVPGIHNVTNAAMAAAMAALVGACDDAIQAGLSAYSLREMRLEMHTTGADITLINDAYNADPTSVRAALGVLDKYAGDQRKIAILGDMLDLGSRSDEAHREVGRHVARLGVDHLFCVGQRARAIGFGATDAGLSDDQVEAIDRFDALHRRLDQVLESGDVVLFKASRSIGLDRAARRLIESVAPTRLYIDLEAIADNFHALRRHIGTDIDVMAVVKSFGYGNDATRISQTLVQEGVDALAVAFPDEAIPLRQRGLQVPILVTNVRAEEADKLVKYELEPLIYTDHVAQALSDQAQRRNRSLGVHLEIDTGMRRAGLGPDDVLSFAQQIQRLPCLHIAGLMTHFAAADDPAQDRFTRHQIQVFRDCLELLDAHQIKIPRAHAANTAGAWRFPEARFDMVRVGLGIYGLHPSSSVEEQTPTAVRPALRLTTRVLHTQHVEAGDTVGYGRTWRAESRRQLATLAAGYNDGFPYFLSNCGAVLINGQRCPVVGSVCMDVTVVDISEAGPVEPGDEAVLFGAQNDAYLHIDEWAALGDSINYELLCNISPRVRRIFLK